MKATTTAFIKKDTAARATPVKTKKKKQAGDATQRSSSGRGVTHPRPTRRSPPAQPTKEVVTASKTLSVRWKGTTTRVNQTTTRLWGPKCYIGAGAEEISGH